MGAPPPEWNNCMTAQNEEVLQDTENLRVENAVDETPVSFEGLGLSDEVLAAIEDLGYESATPIQAGAIPQVLAGRDLLAAAQTGTARRPPSCCRR